MDGLMGTLLQIAKEKNASRITKVRVWLGALSHLSEEHFKYHFDMAARGTLAEGADIEAEESQDLNDPYAQTVLLQSIDVLFVDHIVEKY